MTTTTFILVLYVLPMIISGLLHYFDPKTKTLGDFMDMWWAIFLPFFNFITIICVPFGMFIDYLESSNWLQRIRDIKIKSVLIFFCFFTLFSCGKQEPTFTKKFIVSKSDDNNWTTSGIVECDSVTMVNEHRVIMYVDGQKMEFYAKLIKIRSDTDFRRKN